MLVHELHHLFGTLDKKPEVLQKILDALDILHNDYLLIQHSHDCFLPAAKAYLSGKPCADYRFKAARERRARLGGASRWLYHHQKQTFSGLVKMLSPVPIPDYCIDRWWEAVKAAEINLLKKSRK